MRKLIYFTMASLDGYIEDSNQSLEWVKIDEELHSFVNRLERNTGVYIYGRRMYELMAEYWPTADKTSNEAVEIEYAHIWQQMPKIVFSKTLEKVEGNATLVREDAVEAVKKLKEQPGGDLGVGGAKLAGDLMRCGLIDEYRIFLMPVILGSGMPMIPALENAITLRLVESRTFQSGAIYVRYEAQKKEQPE